MVKWRFVQRWWTSFESLRRRSLRLSSESASSIPKSRCAITIGNIRHAERYHSLNTWNQSSSVPLSFGLLIAFIVAGMLSKYPVGIRQDDCILCVHSRLKPLRHCRHVSERTRNRAEVRPLFGRRKCKSLVESGGIWISARAESMLNQIKVYFFVY